MPTVIYDEFTIETAKKFPWRIEEVDLMLTVFAVCDATPEDAVAWLEHIAQGHISLGAATFAASMGAKPRRDGETDVN